MTDPANLGQVNGVAGASQSEGEERYRSIVQSALDAIISISADNQITEFNPAAEALFGHRRVDVIGLDLADLIVPPEMRTAHREGLRRHRDSSTAPRIGRRIELDALKSDGSRVPVELTVTRESGAGVAQFTAFIRDLSQRRLAEARARQLGEELKASERLLAGVLSNLPGMAFQCLLEDDPTFTFISDGSVQLCGYTPNEFSSPQVKWSSLVREGDRSGLVAARRAASSNEGRYEITYGICDRDGRKKWVLERGTVTPDGAVMWIAGLIVDVTSDTNARHQISLLNAELEARVKRRTAELEFANAELETFSYSIAHDLRGPLTSIAGFARIIEEKVGPRAELAHFFKRIRSGVRHMDDLIDAMLSLARIKRSALAPKRVDLAELAREIIGRLIQGEPDRQVTLDIPPHLWVLGEPLLLRQLMENLIRNAWKFSGKCPSTSIRISSTSTEPGRRTVSVEDKGAGFDVESADRLFKPFVRLHTPTEFEGTGIGLAIVQRIITHHGGRIWATGRAGEGACFSFTLAAPDEAGLPKGEPVAQR